MWDLDVHLLFQYLEFSTRYKLISASNVISRQDKSGYSRRIEEIQFFGFQKMVIQGQKNNRNTVLQV